MKLGIFFIINPSAITERNTDNHISIDYMRFPFVFCLLMLRLFSYCASILVDFFPL